MVHSAMHQILLLLVLISLVNSSLINSESFETLDAILETTIASCKLVRDAGLEKYGWDKTSLFSTHRGDFGYLKKKFVKGLMNGKLVFSFTGSSVTGGGDIYFNESYPIIFDGIFQAAAVASGVDLEVRNVAMGNNPILPYDNCIGAIAGFDADIVTWEQDMMCSGWQSTAVELFIRSSVFLPNRPVVSVLLPAPIVGYTSKADRAARRLLISTSGSMLDLYKNQGFHYIAALDGLKGFEEVEEFGTDRMYNQGKSFGHASWHPSPFGHELYAYILAYSYAQVWIEAIQTIQSMRSESFSFDDLHKSLEEYISAAETAYDVIPDRSEGCAKEYMCPKDSLPRCAVTYTPHFEEDWELKKFIVNTDVLDMSPSFNTSVDFSGRWIYQVHPYGMAAVRVGMMSGSPSARWAVTGTQSSGPVEFEVETSKTETITMCQPRLHYDQYASLFQHATITLDGVDVNLTEVISKICAPLGLVGSGKHTIRVSPTSSKLVGITNLVWF